MSPNPARDPNIVARHRQIMELKVKAPLRKPAEQNSIDGLTLFDQQRSPGLL